MVKFKGEISHWIYGNDRKNKFEDIMTMDALKDKLKERTMEFKAIENFVKSVESYKTFDKESDMAKSMYKQMNVRKKELIKLRTTIKKLGDYIKANIEVMDKFSLKMKKEKKE